MMEENRDNPEHSFSSLKHMIIIHMMLKHFDKMHEQTARLLQYSNRPTVSKNQVTDAINEVLNNVAKYLPDQPNHSIKMNNSILNHFKSSDERMWFKTSIRLGGQLLDTHTFDQLETVIAELRKMCMDAQNPNMFDKSKGDYVLEVLALEIQMCILKKETRRMKQVF